MAKKTTAEALTSARQEEQRIRARVRTLEARLREEERAAELAAKERIADTVIAGMPSSPELRDWVRAQVAGMSQPDQDMLRIGLSGEHVAALFGAAEAGAEDSSDGGPAQDT